MAEAARDDDEFALSLEPLDLGRRALLRLARKFLGQKLAVQGNGDDVRCCRAEKARCKLLVLANRRA
jgi:hypothetical protein